MYCTSTSLEPSLQQFQQRFELTNGSVSRMIYLPQPACITCTATNFCYQVSVWSSWSARVVSGLPLPLPTMFGAPKVTSLQNSWTQAIEGELEGDSHHQTTVHRTQGKENPCMIIKASLRSSKAHKYYWIHLINTNTNFGSCINLIIPRRLFVSYTVEVSYTLMIINDH